MGDKTQKLKRFGCNKGYGAHKGRIRKDFNGVKHALPRIISMSFFMNGNKHIVSATENNSQHSIKRNNEII